MLVRFNLVHSRVHSRLSGSPSSSLAVQSSTRLDVFLSKSYATRHSNPTSNPTSGVISPNRSHVGKPKAREIDYQSQMDEREAVKQSEKAKRKAAYFRNSKAPLFVDSLLLLLRAGTGGDGCSSFARAKYIPYGPPSGGHGGKGGDIYIRAVTGLTSLSKLGSGGISTSGSGGSSDSNSNNTSIDTTSGTIKAGPGAHGTGSFRDGKRGKDRILEVPVGTIAKIYRAQIWDWNEEQYEREKMRKEYENSLVEELGRKKGNRIEEEAEEDLEKEEIYQSESERQIRLREIDEKDEEAALLREQRDSVWRHYPRGGPSAEEQEAEDSYRREEFQSAEERLGMALRRERREKSTKIKELKKDRKISHFANKAKEREVHLQRDDSSGFRFAEEVDAEGTAESSQLQVSETEKLPGFEDSESEASLEESQEVEEEEHEVPLFTIDFSSPTPPDSLGHLIASGGTGGYGNPYFLTSSNRSPKFATRGQRGETRRIRLELKVPADVGLVGMPNVGKSSLLQALTGAGDSSAKVGNWNFTTLNPNVGVIRLNRDGKLIGTGQGRIGGKEERESETERSDLASNSISRSGSDLGGEQDETLSEEAHRLTLLDLPGLLKDASKDVGLGHSFLRHAERCPILVYVVDISAKVPEPWKDVEILKNELEAYKPGLSKRAKLVVANKADALGPPVGLEAQYRTPTAKSGEAETDLSDKLERLSAEKAREKLETLRAKVREMEGRELQVLPVSAMWRLGAQSLARKMKELVKEQGRQV